MGADELMPESSYKTACRYEMPEAGRAASPTLFTETVCEQYCFVP